jgi:hypothetical protein
MSHSYRSQPGTRVPRLHIMSRDIVPTCLGTSFHVSGSTMGLVVPGRVECEFSDHLAVLGEHDLPAETDPSTGSSGRLVIERRRSGNCGGSPGRLPPSCATTHGRVSVSWNVRTSLLRIVHRRSWQMHGPSVPRSSPAFPSSVERDAPRSRRASWSSVRSPPACSSAYPHSRSAGCRVVTRWCIVCTTSVGAPSR